MPLPRPSPTTLLVPAEATIETTESGITSRDGSSAPSKNPILLLHGVGGSGNGYLLPLKAFPDGKGYTVSSPTYGAFDPFGAVGGLKGLAESSTEVAGFVRDLKRSTGADKVDIVGHSGGAFHGPLHAGL